MILPEDCLYLIMKLSSPEDLARFSQTSKLMNNLCSKDSLWHKHIKRWKKWIEMPRRNYKAAFKRRLLQDRQIDRQLQNMGANRRVQKLLAIANNQEAVDCLWQVYESSKSLTNLTASFYAKKALGNIRRRWVMRQWKSWRRGEIELTAEEGANLLSMMFYINLDHDTLYAKLDEIANEFKALLPSDLRPTDVARMLCEFLHMAGFKGNMENYFDPANSFLHLVIKTRKGIPLTLCILFAAIARRVGFGDNVELIGFPRHFLCRVTNPLDNEEVFVDMFHGRIMSREDCRVFARFLGFGDFFRDEFLDPTPLQEVFARLLRNLTVFVNDHSRVFDGSDYSPQVLMYGLLGQIIALEQDDQINHNVRKMWCYLLLQRYPEDRDLIEEFCLESTPQVMTQEERETFLSISDNLIRSDEMAEVPVCLTKPHHVKYNTGELVYHKTFGYTAVIVGWDERNTREPQEDLENGTDQPFYCLLTLSIPLIDCDHSMLKLHDLDEEKYVPEEQLEPTTWTLPDDHLWHIIQARSLGAFFDAFDKERNIFVPNQSLARRYA